MSKPQKIVRDLSTQENKAFWDLSPGAKRMEDWPAWRLAGVTITEEPSAPLQERPSSAEKRR
jgi:hypothetical protein